MNSLNNATRPLTRSARAWFPAKWFMAILMLLTVGCASVGYDFPENHVSEINIGTSTKKDISSAFGTPWRVGVENGQDTWTYGRYRYRLIGQASTKDLVIRFNKKGVVTSYVFNTTDHSE